jgi:transcriptional regulator with XRE-family HTH domain
MAQGNPDLRKAVGRNIRDYRRKVGWSQDVLAERCGLYRTYLSRIECGTANPTLLMLVALASALEVGVCDLLSGPVPGQK